MFLDVLGSHESRCWRSSSSFYISQSSATHHKNRCKITPATTPSTSFFWWWVPSSRRRGGAGEGTGPGARGGTEDDDQGWGLSRFFFKVAGVSLSVPTSNVYQQLLLQIANFTSLKLHSQLQFLHPQTNSISNQHFFFSSLHIYLSICNRCCMLLLLLLLYMSSCCCCSCKKLNFRVWILCVRALLICPHFTEFRISQKAVDSFVFGKSQSSARVSSIFLPFLQVSEWVSEWDISVRTRPCNNHHGYGFHWCSSSGANEAMDCAACGSSGDQHSQSSAAGIHCVWAHHFRVVRLQRWYMGNSSGFTAERGHWSHGFLRRIDTIYRRPVVVRSRECLGRHRFLFLWRFLSRVLRALHPVVRRDWRLRNSAGSHQEHRPRAGHFLPCMGTVHHPLMVW